MKTIYRVSACVFSLIIVLSLMDVIKGNLGMGFFFLCGGFFMGATSWDKKTQGQTVNCIVAAILSVFSVISGIYILMLTVRNH